MIQTPTARRPGKATVNAPLGNFLPDTYLAQILRLVRISYANRNDSHRLTIPVSAFSPPPAVFESYPRGAFFHLYDTWLGVTRSLREDPNNTVGGHPDEAVQQATARTQARECAGRSEEERLVPRATRGARARGGRVTHAVWVPMDRDGARRDEDESQDGVFEGARFGPEADLPSVGDRRR
jgi:hypothetical protein